MKKLIIILCISSLFIGTIASAAPRFIASVGVTFNYNKVASHDPQLLNIEDIKGTADNYDLKLQSSYLNNAKMTFEDQLSKVSKNNDLVIATGFNYVDSLVDVASANPDTSYVIIDAIASGNNVSSYGFKENEGSFLAGVAAAMATETNKVGFIGGMDFYLINKFEVGFVAGVHAVKPEIEVFVDYAGSFSDMDKDIGKSLADAQYLAGADVIYHAAGGVGYGVFESAVQHDTWAIGVDMDQSFAAPDHVLCSMVKNYDVAANNAMISFADGTYVGGTTHELGLAEDGLSISDDAGNLYFDPNIDIVGAIDNYYNQIIDGIIIVPLP